MPCECPSAWLLSKSPSSAQRNFKVVLTLTMNKKHSSEMRFKQTAMKVMANFVFCFTLCLYNIFLGRGKHLKIFLYINNTLWVFQTVSFLGSKDIRGFSLSSRTSCHTFPIIFFCEKLSFHKWNMRLSVESI